ncbi:MAG: restriction endonuclease subunit S [Synergistes sp.]|nr:restriction endonuclease subunit S [Synergistes sp.]
MTAQDLKNAILQLAVQGKLVPQNPNDEPASELLKRIKAEKEQFTKEGKIKKEKPLSPITDDEIPFDIPESWEWVRVADISSITAGGTPSRTNSLFWNGSIPWVKISDISSKYVTETEERITEAGLNSSSAKIFPKGTLLYTIFATIGTVGILSIDAATNQAIAGITFLGEYNLDYLYYILIGLKDIFVAKGKGMAQMNINQTILKNTPIPLPPLAEQKRIVARIEELMPLVEEYGEAEERLTELNATFPDKLRKSILQQAIQGKLTERDPADEPASELLKRIRTEKERLIKEGKIRKEKALPPITEDETSFEIPDNWSWVRLSEICNISDGTHQTPHYVDHGVPFISAQNIKPYRFIPEIHRDVSEKDYLEYNKVVAPEMGDILMTRVGAGIGEAAIIDQDFKFSIYVSLTLIKRYGNELNMEYLLHVLNSPQGRKLAEKKTLGKGASQGNLNLVFIREFVLPVPPLAEQKRIVDRVNELLAVCDELK